jgi:MFS family permease
MAQSTVSATTTGTLVESGDARSLRSGLLSNDLRTPSYGTGSPRASSDGTGLTAAPQSSKEGKIDDGISEISEVENGKGGSVVSLDSRGGDVESHTTEKVLKRPTGALPKTPDDLKKDKKRRLLIFHICVLAFLDMTAYAMGLVPITSLLKRLSIFQGGDGSTSSAQIYMTICVVLTSVFAFVGGPLIGGLSDAFGRFPAVLFTRFMRILFALCLVFVSHFSATPGITVLLFMGYALQGFCDPDMCIAIFYAMIADSFPPKARTFYFGLVSSVFAAPVVIGPFIGEIIQANIGASAVFSIALVLLSINGVYVAFVFPETLVDAPAGMAAKWKVLRQNANPFAFCKELRNGNVGAPYPLAACITVYACFGVASAALQSTVLLYVQDPNTLAFTVSQASYLLSGFGLLLVLSQSVGTKVLLCCLTEEVTITSGMFMLTAGLAMMCFVGNNAVAFLMGLMLTGLAYVVVPSLNGFVSKKTAVGDQGTILACLASVRSIALGMGQLGGGATLALFTSDDPPFELPGFHFLLAAAFAFGGGATMIYVCIAMCNQARAQKVYHSASSSNTAAAAADTTAAEESVEEVSFTGSSGDATSASRSGSRRFSGPFSRARTASRGGLLVKTIWGASNEISMGDTTAAADLPRSPSERTGLASRSRAFSTDWKTRPNRPAALSTGSVLPGVR